MRQLESLADIFNFNCKIIHLDILREVFCLALKVKRPKNNCYANNNIRYIHVPAPAKNLLCGYGRMGDNAVAGGLDSLRHRIYHYQLLQGFISNQGNWIEDWRHVKTGLQDYFPYVADVAELHVSRR